MTESESMWQRSVSELGRPPPKRALSRLQPAAGEKQDGQEQGEREGLEGSSSSFLFHGLRSMGARPGGWIVARFPGPETGLWDDWDYIPGAFAGSCRQDGRMVSYPLGKGAVKIGSPSFRIYSGSVYSKS